VPVRSLRYNRRKQFPVPHSIFLLEDLGALFAFHLVAMWLVFQYLLAKLQVIGTLYVLPFAAIEALVVLARTSKGYASGHPMQRYGVPSRTASAIGHLPDRISWTGNDAGCTAACVLASSDGTSPRSRMCTQPARTPRTCRSVALHPLAGCRPCPLDGPGLMPSRDGSCKGFILFPRQA
jgi:hypothetical protein